jgi:glycosyltransferase involved in cell wall biosynthesis
VLRTPNKDSIEGGLRLKNIFKESTQKLPLISIVTVVFNGEKYIEETIQSVINQSYENIEYIIIDGSSTDRSLEIIKKYDSKIDYWVSEKDFGIYDAMNKGISFCSGDFIGILNSDDYFDNSTCEHIKKAILKNKNIDIFHGNIVHVTFKGKPIFVSKPKDVSKLKTGMVLRHPSCFVARNWYKKHGGYEINLKIASDFKFLYSSFKNNAKFKYLNICTTYMREGGISDIQAKQGWKEVMQVCKELGDSEIQIKYYSIIRNIKYYINKKILKRI